MCDEESSLKQSSGDEFYKQLEAFINFKIPPVIKNILRITQHNCAYSFLNFNEKSLNEIETFMRNDFNDDMIDDGSSTKDYLGFFWQAQEKFKLICGQTAIITNIAVECQRLYETKGKTKPNEGNQVTLSNKIIHLLWL